MHAPVQRHVRLLSQHEPFWLPNRFHQARRRAPQILVLSSSPPHAPPSPVERPRLSFPVPLHRTSIRLPVLWRRAISSQRRPVCVSGDCVGDVEIGSACSAGGACFQMVVIWFVLATKTHPRPKRTMWYASTSPASFVSKKFGQRGGTVPHHSGPLLGHPAGHG